MSEKLLGQVLAEKVCVESVLRWMHTPEAKQENEFPCTRGEFIPYLLNFIHDEALCFQKYREIPKKVHTPKAIRKLELSSKPRRRTVLFPDSSPQTSPKVRNTSLNGVMHSLSPGSPVYARFNTLAVDNSPITTTPKSKNLCLGDFISPNRKFTYVNQKKPSSSNLRTKRINPTNVTQQNCLQSENSFNFKKDPICDNVKPLTNPDMKLLSNVVLPKIQLKEIPPDLKQVSSSDAKQLTVLIRLYVDLIRNNQVLNVTSELYFIVTLLLLKQYESDHFASAIFASIHNVVYFALRCLQQIVAGECGAALGLLDRVTLRLLAASERVQLLDGVLVAQLAHLGDERIDALPTTTCAARSVESSVCFDAATDNRENFPTVASFHAFRKQRDLFYEMLEVWEAQHATDEWSFAMGVGGKLRTLLAMHAEPANFRHLARLVKSQLLLTCGKPAEKRAVWVAGLPHVDAEKLSRLKTRLVAKDASMGISAPPSFPGAQEFYKELVAHAHSHIFCVHLRNALVDELLQLDEAARELLAGADDANATAVSYCGLLQQLQLLAKFVGLIESLPYRRHSTAPPRAHSSDRLAVEEAEGRAWLVPPFDVRLQLSDAASDMCRLAVLVPWLVEYLAMLDAVTLRLPYYTPLLTKLFKLFVAPSGMLPLVVRCALGWLFEQAHFPSEYYFRFLDADTDAISSLSNRNHRNQLVFDLDQRVLHTVCPFLGEFKRLLQYSCNGCSITAKHITPVTAIGVEATSEKRLRAQLQEAFLEARPSTLRKTLEFVAERVAACVVRVLAGDVVLAAKTRATAERKRLFAQHAEHAVSAVGKVEIHAHLVAISASSVERLRSECERVLATELQAKIRPAVQALLSTDEHEQTVDICTQIANRLCAERVRQWIDTRVNASVFKEFDMDIERIDIVLQKEREERLKPKFKSLPVQGRSNIEHVDSDGESQAIRTIRNPSSLMTNLQRQCASLLCSSDSSISHEEVTNTLHNATWCHQHRSDLSDIAWYQVNQQLVNYCILLCTKRPCLITGALLDEFVTFWTRNDEVYLKEIFQRVISVRNTVILMSAVGDACGRAWRSYALLLTRLLDARLLTSDEFETQCLAVFREEWDGATLARICQCLQDVVNALDSKDQFVVLLAFLAEYCTDLDV